MATATDRSSANLQALIRAAAAGDHAAFAQVYQRTHVHLFGVAVRMLGQGQAAEDVLQEAYVSIWKNAGSYRSEVGGQPVQPMTWLIAIVRNKALDALRARARRPESAWNDTGKSRRKVRTRVRTLSAPSTAASSASASFGGGEPGMSLTPSKHFGGAKQKRGGKR